MKVRRMASASSQAASTATKLCSVAVLSYIGYKCYHRRERPIIAVDLDEVLGQFIELLCRYVNDDKVFGSKRYSVSDFDSYLFHEVWGGSREDTTQIVQDFFASSHWADIDNMKPIENAYQVLKSLKSKFRFVICTSRQLQIKQDTIEWVNRFYPDIFEDIVFGNHFGVTGRKISKPDLCAQLGAKMLIDDSSYYAKQCSQTLDYVVLFDWKGQYGWNKTPTDIAPNVRRLQDWNQVKDFLERYHAECQ